MEELKRLRNLEGRHTSLISYLISSETNFWLAAKKFKEELSTAGNIKSKANRSNVQFAWKTIIETMKTIKEIPPNGLAIFVGRIEIKNGEYLWRSLHFVPAQTNPKDWIFLRQKISCWFDYWSLQNSGTMRYNLDQRSRYIDLHFRHEFSFFCEESW